MIFDTYNYNIDYMREVDAYIITLRGNALSEKLSARCQRTCQDVQQNYFVWDAFDGTSEKEIIYPEHAKDQDHYRWLKLMNDKLTITEMATILSHYSLWAHCVKINLPIVILEHDAVMVKKYAHHNGFNHINYLGNLEQFKMRKFPDFPPHSAASQNYYFICRAHAYAIDPAIARQLISHLIRFGISAPADMLIRADLFSIVQTDFYAFDLPDETTITGRDPYWHKDAKEIFSSFV